MDPICKEDYKGYTIKIVPDEDPMDPREGDNLGKMVCFHRRHNLGDRHDFTQEEIQVLLSRHDVISLPLYLYDHSGLRMNTGGFSQFDPGNWDSGQVGVIFTTFGDIRKAYNRKKISQKIIEQAKKVLQQEVATYDDFLSGNVYGFAIYAGDRLIDSCFAFFGDYKYCIEQARESIDCHIDEIAKWPIICGDEGATA